MPRVNIYECDFTHERFDEHKVGAGEATVDVFGVGRYRVYMSPETVLEFLGPVYATDDAGNLVDADGNVIPVDDDGNTADDAPDPVLVNFQRGELMRRGRPAKNGNTADPAANTVPTTETVPGASDSDAEGTTKDAEPAANQAPSGRSRGRSAATA